MSSSDDENDCPLCMEEMDMSDRNFKPCPCGYQICRFCWNHIKENLNGRCPACRREYSDTIVEFTPVTPAEIQRFKNEKKQKDREKKEMEANNRRHLANMRVVQKTLVYVIGLSSVIAGDEKLLRQYDWFGQYGKIIKVVVNKKTLGTYNQQNSKIEPTVIVGVYVTFSRKDDAARCIAAIDGTVYEGRVLRASYGTTKYCSYYLRGLSCQNPGCMYLHEPGEDADSYTKEEMSVGKHHLKAHLNSTAPGSPVVGESSSGMALAAPFGLNAPPQQDKHEDNAPPKVAWKPVVVDVVAHAEPEAASTPQPIQPSSSGSPSSPSALPRTAAWATAKQGGGMVRNGSNGTILEDEDSKRIECDIFQQIFPGEKLARAHSSFLGCDTGHVINTSHLHRYLFLARQAKEHYNQISGAMFHHGQQHLGSSPLTSTPPFVFDPFGVGQKRVGAVEQSRFGFAQQQSSSDAVSELSDRFQRLNPQQQPQQAMFGNSQSQQQQQHGPDFGRGPQGQHAYSQRLEPSNNSTDPYRPPGFQPTATTAAAGSQFSQSFSQSQQMNNKKPSQMW